MRSGSLSPTEFDMNQVMLDLLSQEYITDLEERGLDSMDSGTTSPFPSSSSGSYPVSDKQKKSGKGRTFRINDIRQQHQANPIVPRKSDQKARVQGAIGLDPWTQLSSLSTFFSSLVPGSQDSDFQQYLHNPKYQTPSKAIRGALMALVSRIPSKKEINAERLIHFLEVLHSTHEYYDDLTLEERDQLIEDSEIALKLCSAPDTALELINRLIELDMDAIRDKTQGVYHAQVETFPPMAVSQNPATPTNALPHSLPKIQPLKDPPLTLQHPNTASDQWISIPIRRAKSEHPLAESIPAYASSSHNGFKAPPGRPEEKYRFNQSQAWQRRNELLKQASHYWRRGQRVGGSRSVGGNIAFFYADRARKLAEESRKWGLERAIASIEAKR
jgi:hypothetical protein